MWFYEGRWSEAWGWGAGWPGCWPFGEWRSILELRPDMVYGALLADDHIGCRRQRWPLLEWLILLPLLLLLLLPRFLQSCLMPYADWTWFAWLPVMRHNREASFVELESEANEIGEVCIDYFATGKIKRVVSFVMWSRHFDGQVNCNSGDDKLSDGN